jgi:hypothetical protein
MSGVWLFAYLYISESYSNLYIGITRHPLVPVEVASLKGCRMKKLEIFYEISDIRRDVLDLLWLSS